MISARPKRACGLPDKGMRVRRHQNIRTQSSDAASSRRATACPAVRAHRAACGARSALVLLTAPGGAF